MKNKGGPHDDKLNHYEEGFPAGSYRNRSPSCRTEAEFAELREFSEVEAGVVTERTTELETALQELQGHVAALEARVEAANGQREEVAKEVRGSCQSRLAV